MPSVYFSLGSNVGDSPDILRTAIRDLAGALGPVRSSRLWHSRPRYVVDQPDYVNAALCADTEASPHELLDLAHRIEAAHGRDRSRERPKGPRSLDIDIVLYGDRLIVEPDLIIPHPGLAERKFVLLPLLELDPDLRHPATGEALASILQRLPAQGIYLMTDPGYDRLYI
ncbi:MAG TPA: 2-amino-4-hydroxy-6-hydroxymethyldihydropteridine diphosphokinase [Rectinemataceae bacterium]|nr:2-amino-4-hydroxy-6-hydroxymethyldihydropteridine diphosphokinase [Rectinemataceae bacterium]